MISEYPEAEFRKRGIAKGGMPLPHPLRASRKASEKKKEWKRCKLFKIINFTPSSQKIRQAIF